MRSVRRLAAVAATILALTVLVPSVAAVAPHSGDLYLTKDCSTEPYTGAAGDYCTFTSTFDAITSGSKIYYSSAADSGTGILSSDVVIVVRRGTTATGHCTVNLSTGAGYCSILKGTGGLAGFHASVAVSWLGGADYAWTGTYGYH